MTEERPEEGREEIRVMLVDDHDSFRHPLALMPELDPDLVVVAQAGSVSEAREVLVGLYEEGKDLTLPDGRGTGSSRNLSRPTGARWSRS